MSGHNKWSKIKHKKATTDARKSKVFGKLVRLIQVEAKKAQGDVNSPALKNALEKAKRENMPLENIERAIKKASEQGATMASVVFEAYGPSGVQIVVTGLTDNNNRTSSEIKHILSKNAGSLGSLGCVMWNFTKNRESKWEPQTTIDLTDDDLEKLSQLVDALEDNDDVMDVITNAS